MFVDANDIILVDNLENIKQKFLSFNKPLVISAEQNAYPDPEVYKLYPKESKDKRFRYVNSGTYIGYVSALKQMLKSLHDIDYKCKNLAEPNKKQDNCDDQRCLTTYFIENPDKCTLDYEQKIFSLVYGLNEDDLDYIAPDNVVNKITKQKTSVIHASGGWWNVKNGRNYYKEMLEKMEKNKN
jgi:hypothetical protein